MLPLNDSAILFINRDFAALLGLIVVFCVIVRAVRYLKPNFLKSHWLIQAPTDFLVSGFWEILIIFIIRAFFFEMYLIPSGSMQPTVYPGDLVLVNKFAYGLKFPGTNTLLWANQGPDYGDPVVFLDPVQPTVRKMIKRVIAKGGDRLVVNDDKIVLNGHEISSDFLYRSFEYLSSQHPRVETLFYEQKLGSHVVTIETIPSIRRHKEIDITIPQGYYFVMGDNRDNSLDSRYWGLVPERFVCGKAQYVLFSFGKTEEQHSLQRFGRLS
jgi:signal peptidase I